MFFKIPFFNIKYPILIHLSNLGFSLKPITILFESISTTPKLVDRGHIVITPDSLMSLLYPIKVSKLTFEIVSPYKIKNSFSSGFKSNTLLILSIISTSPLFIISMFLSKKLSVNYDSNFTVWRQR